MKVVRHLNLALASAVLMTAAVGPAEAVIRQSYDPEAVAYSYSYYADEARTQYLGSTYDTCGGSQANHWVIRAYVPTAHYDQSAMFVCTSMGPYLPPDF